MKKKILAMLLALSCVCVPVAGCGSDKKDDSSDKKTESVDEKEDEKTDEKKEDSKKDEKKEEKEIEVKRGTVTDNVYKNETFGVSFPISDSMIVCTDEQIAETLNLGQDMLAEQGTYTVETMEEAMEGALYDTILLFSDNSSNCSVIYEDMKQSQGIAVDEEQYAKAVKNTLSSMEAAGYEIGEIEKQDIGGTEFTAMTVKTSEYTQRYFLHRVDNYMIEFIFTYTADTEQEINDFISSITYENPL